MLQDQDYEYLRSLIEQYSLSEIVDSLGMLSIENGLVNESVILAWTANAIGKINEDESN